jgi:hypothetical protein
VEHITTATIGVLYGEPIVLDDSDGEQFVWQILFALMTQTMSVAQTQQVRMVGKSSVSQEKQEVREHVTRRAG